MINDDRQLKTHDITKRLLSGEWIFVIIIKHQCYFIEANQLAKQIICSFTDNNKPFIVILSSFLCTLTTMSGARIVWLPRVSKLKPIKKCEGY